MVVGLFWHDAECKRLQQQFRELKGDPQLDAEHRAILQQYKRRVKQLVRQYRVEVALERARQWRVDRNSFWRWYRPNGPSCPFTAKAIAEAFGAKLNSYKGALPRRHSISQDAQMHSLTSPQNAQQHLRLQRP